MTHVLALSMRPILTGACIAITRGNGARIGHSLFLLVDKRTLFERYRPLTVMVC